jgi:hypothetical protein
MTVVRTYALLQIFNFAAAALNAWFFVRNLSEGSWMAAVSGAATILMVGCFVFNYRRMLRYRCEEQEWKAQADMVLRSYPLPAFWPPPGENPPQTDADRIAMQMQIYRSQMQIYRSFRLQHDRRDLGFDPRLEVSHGRLPELELDACYRRKICPDCAQVTLDREQMLCTDATCGSRFVISPTGAWSRA